jgi:zinc transport system substrate-binding protein
VVGSAQVVKRTVLTFVLAAGLAACGGSEDGANAGPDATNVVAAFYPLAFAAEQVGGAAMSVENVTPTGAEPHDIELTPRDVEDVRDADVVLYLGGGFQPAVEQAVEGASGRVVDLLAGLTLRRTSDGEEQLDPHVWLDPVRFAGIVGRIGQVLGRPAAAARLGRRLDVLDARFAGGLRRCERREIVTSHAAFGYLAERHGLEQVAIGGVEPEAEPTPRALERVVREVRASGATTIFFEPLVSPRVARTVARETGAQTATLNPLEGLTEEEAEAGEDYFSLMADNLVALRKALACR